jgi:photosystem II stability/assembly factor-like uncharacterized protein
MICRRDIRPGLESEHVPAKVTLQRPLEISGKRTQTLWEHLFAGGVLEVFLIMLAVVDPFRHRGALSPPPADQSRGPVLVTVARVTRVDLTLCRHDYRRQFGRIPWLAEDELFVPRIVVAIAAVQDVVRREWPASPTCVGPPCVERAWHVEPALVLPTCRAFVGIASHVLMRQRHICDGCTETPHHEQQHARPLHDRTRVTAANEDVFLAGSGHDRTPSKPPGVGLFATSDGGRTWQQLHPPGLVEDIEAAGTAVYAMVRGCATATACEQPQSTAAALYRIEDGGQRFTDAGPPAALDDQTQLITSDSTVLLLMEAADLSPNPSNATVWSRTADGPWQQHSAPCGWFGADAGALAAWSATGLALVCGSEPGAGDQLKTGYVSTDGAQHWRKVADLPDIGGYIDDLAAADADNWVLSEARGALDVTHDGGQTGHQADPSDGDVEGWGTVAFATSTIAVAAPWTLNGSTIAITTDTGQTWSAIKFPSGR